MIASFPSVAEDYNGSFDPNSVWKGAGTSIDPVKKQEIVLSKSDVGIELEVAELQAIELELSSAMLS